MVILDLVMPVLDGHRLYQAMQSDPALAGSRSSSRRPARRAPPGVLVVPKPVKLDRLLEMVADLWRTKIAVQS